MQHSKNKVEKQAYIPITRTDEPDTEDMPVTIMTAVSVPAWKTPSVFQNAGTSRKSAAPDASTKVSSSPFAASTDANADLQDLDALPGEKIIETTDAVILAERDVKPSWWSRLVSVVSQYSPLSVSDSDLSRINLYLCAGGLILAVLIFVFVVL
jgi:hypothetical protein